MSGQDRIMIVAGEASADAHAASLVRELFQMRPGLEVYGVGGTNLLAAGADLIFDFSRTGVVGISEVLPELGNFYRAYRALVKSVSERRPRGVILLDLPDFNLFLAKKIRQVSPDTTIIYYISPQVWAWRPGRVGKIAERADAMLVLFPFEVDIYQRAGMDVEFVGHPLRDLARPSASPPDLRREFGIGESAHVVGLLPGSRKAEIERCLPVMAEAARVLADQRPGLEFLLALAPTIEEEMVMSPLGGLGRRVRMIKGRSCDVMAAADVVAVASGTATLEAAIVGTPMVVLGVVSRLTYAIVKPRTLVENYSLPNIIAGRGIVPELIQREAGPARLVSELSTLLDSAERRAEMKQELARVRDALGEGGASRRAAAAVHQRLWGAESGAPARA